MTSAPHVHPYDAAELADALDLLVMKGRIYARDKCPQHGRPYVGPALHLRCPVDGCTERPRGPFRVEVKHNGVKSKISSDKKGDVLDSQRLALKVLVQVNAEIAQKRFDPGAYNQNRKRTPGAFLFRTYADKHVSDKEAGIGQDQAARATVRMQRLYLTRHVNPVIGDMDIRDVNRVTLKELRRVLLAKEAHRGKDGATLSPKYVWNVMQFVLGILREAKADGVAQEVPVAPKVKWKRSRKPTLRHDQQIAVLRSIQKDEPGHALIFWCLYFTGHRPAEVAALRVRDYLRETKMLDFRRTYSDDELRDGRKSDEEHLLPIPEDLCAMLDESLAKRYASSIPPHPDALLFVPPRPHRGPPAADHYRNNTMPRIWKRHCGNRTGVPYIGLYESIKHSLGRRMIELGMPRSAIAELLGITEQSTKFYAEYEAEMLRPLVEKLHPSRAPGVPLENKPDA